MALLDLRSPPSRPLLAALAAVAAAKVLLMAALLPPFTNLDEAYHYDTVAKYSAGRFPARLEPFAPEIARAVVVYGSPEYYRQGEIRAPLWAWPEPERSLAVEPAVARWTAMLDHESVQPPLYYLAAGAWRRLGAALGLGEPWLLLWTRALNAAAAAGLVWLAAALAGSMFPGRPFVAWAAAAWAAAWPQDAFYGASNDAAAGLAFGAALWLLTRLEDEPRPALAGWAAAAVFAALLGKLSCFGLLALWAVCIWRLAGRGAHAAAGALALAALPLTLWLGRDWARDGDLLGARQYAEAVGWGVNTLAEALRHPVLRPRGAAVFLWELAVSFWRGEVRWRGEVLRWAAADAAFALASAACLAASAWRSGLGKGRERPKRALAWGCLAALLGFLLAFMLRYRLSERWYPKPDHPFLTHGRLICGAAAPFAVFFADGLERLLGRRAKAGLAALLLLVAVSEAALVLRPAGSAYGWLRLRGADRQVIRYP